MTESLEQLVQDWLDLDKVRIFSVKGVGYQLTSLSGQSEATRSEIQGLWESGNHKELENRLRYLSLMSSFCRQAVTSCSKEAN